MRTAGDARGRSGTASSVGSDAGSRPRETGSARRLAAGNPPRARALAAGRWPPVGNYRQHITFAGALGALYAWAAFVLAGVHWLYGSVAALLTTLSGLLPDLDSD